MTDLIYAVDFGTSNSLISAANAVQIGNPLPIDPKQDDPSILKSVLFSPARGDWFYGQEAIDSYGDLLHEGRLLRSFKKYLPDPSFERTTIHGASYSIIDIVATFLKEMRQRADRHVGSSVERVLMGRPAAFSSDKKKDKLAQDRLEAAAKSAGFKEVYFCPEPIAAAFEFKETLTEPKTVLIADFGGGTSDFTVLHMSQNAFKESDVLSLGGLSLAGDAYDGSIMEHMISPHFGSELSYKLPLGKNELKIPRHLLKRLCSAPDIAMLAKRDILSLLRDAQRWSMNPEDALRMQRLFVLVEDHLGYKLFQSIEATKRKLSDQASDIFEFDYPEIEISQEVFSKDFTERSSNLTRQIVSCLDQTLSDAGIKAEEIEIVCCTGGTAKIASLQEALVQKFGRQKLMQHRHFHSVINGLALKAKDICSS
ncbi:MAG: Hsp70 family protein [Oligoflexales bacterium]